jgi:hypothetical protein
MPLESMVGTFFKVLQYKASIFYNYGAVMSYSNKKKAGVAAGLFLKVG